MQEKEERFNRKYLTALILPLVIEQVLSVSVGMADMIMVSGAGETVRSVLNILRLKSGRRMKKSVV